MKKLISIMLIICIILLNGMTTYAIEVNSSSISGVDSSFPVMLPAGFEIGESKYGDWAWLNTEEYVATIVVKSENNITLSYVDKEYPSIVYEYKLNSAELNSMGNNVNAVSMLRNETSNRSCKTFDTSSQETRAIGDQFLENNIEMMIAEKYEEEYENEVIYETFRYSNLYIQVVEDLTIDTDVVGLTRLAADMEMASAVSSLVANFDITHAIAWEGLSEILGAAAETLTFVGRLLNVQDYRGTMLYFRSGWAKTAYSSETLELYTTASKTNVNHIFIDRDAVDEGAYRPEDVIFVLDSNRETIYIPSEYSFSNTGICETIVRDF